MNLTHYLALRQSDERSLQRKLGRLGLSSLGRCEPHVLATVESVRAALDTTTSVPVPFTLSFRGRTRRPRPQYGRSVRPPAPREGSTSHGDASE